jgi:outer membrane protein assembly factor BamB
MSAVRHHVRNLALVALVAAAPSVMAASADDRDDALAARKAVLDQKYAFGPSAAAAIDYRIAWQTSTGDATKRVDVVDEDVYVLSDQNRLTRIDRSSGSQIWTTIAADPLDAVWGVTPGLPRVDDLPFGQNDDDRIYVTSDPVVFVLDHKTGAVVGRQDLERIPSTDVVRRGSYLIFGSRMGQIIWHQFTVGQAWRANQLKGPIVSKPILVGSNGIAVASEGGTFLMLDAKSAGRIWGERLFDGVTAPLAAGGGKVFAASKDQYLWAFNAGNGDTAWRYFTESPLTEPPTYVDVDGGRVLQWVPSEGLVCLEANPKNAVEGRKVWTLPGITGRYVGRIKGDVALWDAKAKALRLVDVSQGAVTRTVPLPQVERVSMDGETIFAIAGDGRVVRLDPIG